jgi:DNA/RNA endonuclease YhcR with UshA esterase domain
MSAAGFASNTPKHDCVSFAEASQHVGGTQCVRGTVLHVEYGSNGVTLLNFCKDAKACPFTVVVLPGDLKKVGDIRQLEGLQIEIKGTIENYDGRVQIVLHRTQQLQGDAAFLLFPRVPTDYDAERAGHYHAGGSTHAKAAKKKRTTQGEPVSIEDSGEPQ